MQVQDVVNNASTDFRTILSNSGADANIIIPWVDRVHKEVLHSSIYSAYNRATQTLTMTPATSAYTLGTAARRIVSCFNRFGNRVVNPFMTIAGPVPMADQTQGPQGVPPLGLQDRADLQAKINSRFVEFYDRSGSTGINFYPTPVFADVIEIVYEQEVTTVSALGTSLIPPDDALDIMVAGVNMYFAQYLGRAQDVQTWALRYEQLKKGELAV